MTTFTRQQFDEFTKWKEVWERNVGHAKQYWQVACNGFIFITPATWKNKALADLVVMDGDVVDKLPLAYDEFAKHIHVKVNKSYHDRWQRKMDYIERIRIVAEKPCIVTLFVANEFAQRWHLTGGETILDNFDFLLGDANVEFTSFHIEPNLDLCENPRTSITLYGVKFGLKQLANHWCRAHLGFERLLSYKNLFLPCSQFASQVAWFDGKKWLPPQHPNARADRCISTYVCAHEHAAQQRQLMGLTYSPSMVRQYLFDTVFALSPLGLPDYVVLWIIDWLPHVAHVWSELKKITLIRGVSNSIKRLHTA
jgi:hypothetical protein